MSGVTIRFELKDARVRRALKGIEELSGDLSPVMRSIAFLLENSTKKRFRDETAPDGTKWKPSLRQQLKGGKTLTLDSHLVNSIQPDHGRDFARVGTNRIYAGIHQFGGVIKPKTAGGTLRFQLAGGAFVAVKKVTMPKRPFLGVNADDKREIKELVLGRFERLLRA